MMAVLPIGAPGVSTSRGVDDGSNPCGVHGGCAAVSWRTATGIGTATRETIVETEGVGEHAENRRYVAFPAG